MTDQEIISKELMAIKADLIAKHRELGMPASGDWIDSIEVKTTANHGEMEANDYTWYLANGRRPGTMPPIAAIEKWIKDKGIEPIGKKISISSLAFLIARKIKEKGTRYYQQGGTDLIDSVITEERIQNIIDQVGTYHIAEFQSQIIKLFQTELR